MFHMTASRAWTVSWPYDMVAAAVYFVAVTLLVGCAGWGRGDVGSTDTAVEADGNGTDNCLANLPAPTPNLPAHRVIQLVNCSDQTLLGCGECGETAWAAAEFCVPS